MTTTYIIVGLVLLAIIAGGIAMGPDIARYMKMRSM